MLESRRLKVGVIGGGAMGYRHVASLLTITDADLVGVAAPDVDPRLVEVCAGAGIKVDDDISALLGSGELNAVVIATPTDSHVDLIKEAADLGLNVFCEKPLARTCDEALAAVSYCERAGVRLAVGHVVRYFPAYAWIHDEISTGRVGRPALAKCRRMSGPPGVVREWYRNVDRSGGLFTDMGVHDFDWLLWSLGPVERVSALVADIGAGQVAMAVLAHVSGAISSVELSWIDPTGFWTSVEVSGPDGIVRHDSRTSSHFRVDLFPAAVQASPTVQVPVSGARDDPYREEMCEALRWFAGGPPPRSVGSDAVAAVALADAAHLSAKLREPVALKAEYKS